MKHRYTYHKAQKLKSSKQIGILLSEGKVLKCFPFRAVYKLNHEEKGLQAGVAVSKRKFKRATDRNRIKRLMREAWRLNSVELREKLEENATKAQVFILFVDNKIPSFAEVEPGIKTIVDKMTKALG